MSGADDLTRLRVTIDTADELFLSEEPKMVDVGGGVMRPTNAKVLADLATQMNGAQIYTSVALGLSSTAAGSYFSVPSPESAEYLILYRNNTGAAVEIKRYPSSDIMEPVTATQLSIESGTIKLGTVDFDSNITFEVFTRAFGYAAPYDCKATSISIVVAAPSVGEVHVYRHSDKSRGQHVLDFILPVNLAITGVNKVPLPAIALKSGDIVAYAPKSGGYLRGDTTGALIGAQFSPAPVTVGARATVGTGARPSIEIALVKSEKVNSLEGRIQKVESGVGASVGSSLLTLGSISPGSGDAAAPSTAFSFGAKDACPQTSLLSSVRHKTNTQSGRVYYCNLRAAQSPTTK